MCRPRSSSWTGAPPRPRIPMTLPLQKSANTYAPVSPGIRAPRYT